MRCAGERKARRIAGEHRLLREMHRRLMAGVAGVTSRRVSYGRPRTGSDRAGSTIESAPFVPPPPSELPELLSDWERFANEEPEMPVLVQNALLHAQFETIHPFLDGNGRLGQADARLLPRGARKASGAAPLLERLPGAESRRLLQRRSRRFVELGDRAPWVNLFLTSVKVEAADAVGRAQETRRAAQSISRSGSCTRDCKCGSSCGLDLREPGGHHPFDRESPRRSVGRPRCVCCGAWRNGAF